MLDEDKTRLEAYDAMLQESSRKLSTTYHLPNSLATLLALLLNFEIVTPEVIEQRLKLAAQAKVSILRLRRIVEPQGVIIHSHRNVGYWLEQEAKDVITRRVEERTS